MEKAYWRKKLPPGFQFWMENLGRSIVYAQPDNIYEHAAKYLEEKLMERNMALSRLPTTSYLQKLSLKKRERKLAEELPKDEESEAIIRVDEAKAESAHTFPRTKSLREQTVRSEGAVVSRDFPSPLQLQKTDGDESGRETPTEVSEAVARTLQATQETPEEVSAGEHMETYSQEDAHESHEKTLLLESSQQSVPEPRASAAGSRSTATGSERSQSTGDSINSLTALERKPGESHTELADHQETTLVETEQSKDLSHTNSETLRAIDKCEVLPGADENEETVTGQTEQPRKTKSNAVGNVNLENESLASEETTSGPLVLRPDAGPLVPVAAYDSSNDTDSQNASEKDVPQEAEDGSPSKEEVIAINATAESLRENTVDFVDSNEEEQTIEVGAVSTSVEAIAVTKDEMDQASEEERDKTEENEPSANVDKNEETREQARELDSGKTVENQIEESSLEESPSESQNEHTEENANETGSLMEKSIKQGTESKQMIEDKCPLTESNGDETQEISPDKNPADEVVKLEGNGNLTSEEQLTAEQGNPDEGLKASGEISGVTNEESPSADSEQTTDERKETVGGCDVTVEKPTSSEPENPTDGATESVEATTEDQEKPTDGATECVETNAEDQERPADGETGSVEATTEDQEKSTDGATECVETNPEDQERPADGETGSVEATTEDQEKPTDGATGPVEATTEDQEKPTDGATGPVEATTEDQEKPTDGATDCCESTVEEPASVDLAEKPARTDEGAQGTEVSQNDDTTSEKATDSEVPASA